MSFEMIALLMFASMMLMLMTGQRVFAGIGFVAVVSAMLLWGDGGVEIAFTASMKLMKWYPLLTLPLFIYMGFILSESGIADDLYRMFHVWMGGVNGGLAIGTIGLMVLISAITLASTGLGLLVAVFVTTKDQADSVSTMIVLIMSAMGGSWWPLFIMPQFMQDLAHLTITAWAMEGFYDLLYFDLGLAGILKEVGVLLLMTILFFGLAIFRFRFE